MPSGLLVVTTRTRRSGIGVGLGFGQGAKSVPPHPASSNGSMGRVRRSRRRPTILAAILPGVIRLDSSALRRDELLRLRLANQHLAAPSLSDPTAPVAHLGAVQSQDYPAAKWALFQRLVGASDQTIEDAFTAGAILRTHVMRPTWHFVAPADLRWLLALTAPRVKIVLASYDRKLGIDAALLARSHDAIVRALESGQHLTRTELDAALRRAGIAATNGQVLGHLVMHAELDALICSGPRRGKQFTYALVDGRVPPAAPLSRDESLAELAVRYFTSHGPATVRDFVWWSGLTIGDARRGIALADGRLVAETVDGLTCWLAPTGPPLPMPEPVYLLANYDEYTVAYRDRDAYYDPALAAAAQSRAEVPFANVILVDGRVGGLWRRTLSAKSVAVEARWFVDPTPAQRRAFAEAVERYAAFLGLRAELV